MVKPSTAVPEKYRNNASIVKPKAGINMNHPKMVTTCSGAPEKEVMLRSAYFTRLQKLHLEVPISRSCTSKGIWIVLNPTQEDKARKNGVRSGISRRASTAFRSRSLKSEAFFSCQFFVSRLMIP